MKIKRLAVILLKYLFPPLVVITALFLFLSSRYTRPFLTYNQIISASSASDKIGTEMLKGDKVDVPFTASYDNLGTLEVRFYNFNRINTDFVNFRIREKGRTGWYYEGRYKVDQFQPDQLFPFGFPPISNSKGKTYEFEIVSEEGKPGNSISLSMTNPLFVSKYSVDKSSLIKNPINGLIFLTNKTLYIYSDLTSTVGLIDKAPLIFVAVLVLLLLFYVWPLVKIGLDASLKMPTKNKKITKMFLYGLLALLFFSDLFVFGRINFFLYILNFIAVIVIVRIFKFPNSKSLFTSLVLIMVSYLLNLVSLVQYTGIFVAWYQMFLLVGIVQILIEENKDVKKFLKRFKI